MNDTASRRPRWTTVARTAFVVAALSVGVYTLSRDREQAWAAVVAVGAGRVVIATVLVVCGVVASCEAWRRCLLGLGGTLDRVAAARIFYITQMGKYVPGGIWTFVGQMALARRYGVGRGLMALAGMVFIGIHLVTGTAIAAPLLLSEAMAGRVPWLGWLLVAGSVCILLVPSVLTGTIRQGLRLARRNVDVPQLDRRTSFSATALLLGTWTCYGVATAVLAAPLEADRGALSLLALSTGAFAAAWVAGLLVVFAPAGIGAREAVLVAALAPTMGAVPATTVAILVRAVHTLADVLLAAVTSRGAPSAHQLSVPEQDE